MALPPVISCLANKQPGTRLGEQIAFFRCAKGGVGNSRHSCFEIGSTLGRYQSSKHMALIAGCQGALIKTLHGRMVCMVFPPM
jgi:hypothetical protein